MSIVRLIFRTLLHYPWSSLATTAGMAIATAAICGALIIGHSLTRSLEDMVRIRLGQTTHILTAGERLLTQSLQRQMQQHQEVVTAPVLKSEAVLSIQGTNITMNRVQVLGVDTAFANFMEADVYNVIKPGEIVISDHLASRLSLKVGDEVLLRMRTLHPIPPNTPLVSNSEPTIARRVRIANIATRAQGSHFNTEISQISPYNIFVDLQWLNSVMSLENRCNLILIQSRRDHSYLQSVVQQSLHANDIGLELKEVEKNEWEIRSERIFIDSLVGKSIFKAYPQARPTLSYFANRMGRNHQSTPYSFIHATDRFPSLQSGQIIINQWLANDLQVQEGDSLHVDYFLFGILRELQEHSASFRIQEVISMEEALKDKALIPHLPGLTDAASCRDWQAGIPIHLPSIREQDEQYWNLYRGTPKAWISLSDGQRLWSNRFGNLTNIQLTEDTHKDTLSKRLVTYVDPFRLEFLVRSVKAEGITAARSGVDFAQLFAGMGIFIVFAGLLLSVLLLQFSLIQRKRQWHLCNILGFNHSLSWRIVVGETLILILISNALGVFLSMAYSKAVFWGLNQLWYDMVRTDVLTLYFEPLRMLAGAGISIIIALLTTAITLKHSLKHTFVRSHAELTSKTLEPGNRKIIRLGVSAIFVTFAAFFLWSVYSHNMFFWLLSGISLLLGLLLLSWQFLYVHDRAPAQHWSILRLSLLNIKRHPARSVTITSLLACSVFLITVLAANRKDSAIDVNDQRGGTGGFSHMAETTVPVLENLSDSSVQAEHSLPHNIRIVPFLSAFDDNASCHNLNRVTNPRIIATHTHELEGRFRFVAQHAFLHKDTPWTSLAASLPNGIIPAVADQTVIQWGLGKQIGDTLHYRNALGEKLHLLLVGALNNTILQGNIVIDKSHFQKHFPTTDGATLFLIASNNHQTIAENDFELVFRDFGWDMIPADQQLAAFNSVENTYLSVFFLLGALGILIGSIGFTVVMLKTMMERKREITLFKMLGYSTRWQFKLYFYEYGILFVCGYLTGLIPGLIASMNVMLAGFHTVSPAFFITTLLALLLNGIVWMVVVLMTYLTPNLLSRNPIHGRPM